MREWGRPCTSGEADVDPPTRGLPFIRQRVCLVVLTYQLIGEDIAAIFPSVIGLGVSFPLDQVLQNLPFPKSSVISDGLDFILLFSVDDVWGRSREVGSVLFRFMIRGK